MGRALHLFNTVSDFEEMYNGEGYTEPWVSYIKSNQQVDFNKIIDVMPPEVEYSNYLTYDILDTSEDNNTFAIGNPASGNSTYTIWYSLNGGSWVACPPQGGGYLEDLSDGDEIRIKGYGTFAELQSASAIEINTGAKFNLHGNFLSLFVENFENKTSLSYINSALYGFYDNILPGIFRSSSVVDASNLILPKDDLADGCYIQLFKNCPYMTKAPVLMADQLADGCYDSIFSGCTSLNTIVCLASDISSEYSDPTYNWIEGVGQTGTFYKKRGVDWSGKNSGCGIPSGWTVVEV